MVKKILRIVIALIGVYLGYGLSDILLDIGLNISKGPMLYLYYGIIMSVFGIIFYFVSPWLIDKIEKLIDKVEKLVLKQQKADLFIGLVGIIIGIIIAFLVSLPISMLKLPTFLEFVITLVSIILYLAFASLGYRLAMKNKEDLKRAFNKKKNENLEVEEDKPKKLIIDKSKVSSKLLDTSVIIDGRIKQIANTGFIDGDLIVPNFVLEELQFIADSADEIKRERGRRGLDIVKDLQKSKKVSLVNSDKDYNDTKEVDIKLLKFAKETGASIITNDFNLNKLAIVQDIKVLNINDLANSVKTVVIPGEKMIVNIIKEGREKKQGLAYLDDGTMIVVEDAKHLIGQTVEVEVTTVLQTAAGKMIFTKITNS